MPSIITIYVVYISVFMWINTIFISICVYVYMWEHDGNRCYERVRGLEIANTIGNRSGKAVSIKRLNKLVYKVRSQTNHDQWYNVINTYDDGWICECLDFQARHQNCKHIHAVHFSKLLRKKIYQDTILTTITGTSRQDVNPKRLK